MSAEERNKQPASQKTNTTHSEIRNVKDARELFAAFIADERELNRAATSFVRLGDELSGRTASRDERARTLQKFYEQITLDPATNMERLNDDKAAMLQRTLAEMREQNLAVQSSPQARQAHLEVDSYTYSTDDLRALYEVPEDRTRAEHANYLNQTNQEARHLFERGAGLYGETLIIPREASGMMERAEQVRLGSLAYAVREFVPLIGEEQAKIKAAEFVELGKQIAGRTADGDTRLVTFRAFYQEIKKDEQGRARTRTEQAEQLEPVFERMRVLAAAMREQEWKHEPYEFVSLEDWERGHEEHQRDAEREAHGRLTFHLDELFDADRNEEREEKEHADVKERDDERAVIGGSFAQVEYERIPLNHTPPRLPDGLTAEDEERLRYEVIPRLDRQIEAGVRPQDIMRGLSGQAEKETRRDREQEIAQVLLERAPDANQEHPLTREEEARALYTLRSLGTVNTDEIKQRGFTPHERAAAIDMVGGRLAQDYRDEMHKLKTFADLESEREWLNDEALQFREAQRATPEFQLWLAVSRAQERDNRLSELEALTRANTRRALTETEMRALLLSTAPAHYTSEMRDLHLNHSVSARGKAERIKGLEQGTLAPSPSLKLLLAEFDRTKSDNPAQHGRNIKSFLADYLNPPGANRNRFSAHNLYDLRLKLAPVERDYLFKVIDSTKQAVISGGMERQHETGQNKLREFNPSISANREQDQIKGKSIQHDTERNELRERLEERVSAYLVSVIGQGGVRALESSQESLHHAAQVMSIIKNTLAENARVPETLTITHERIAHIAGKLVGEMPYALREERARIINQNHTHALTEPFRATLYSKDTPLSLSKTDERELVERITREAMQPAIEHNLNDETVEQKASRAFGQTLEPSFAQTSIPIPPLNPSLPHQPRAPDLIANPKEQHVRQRSLSR